MKKRLFGIGLVIFFFLLSGIASAGQIGPTEPTAQPGKFAVGLGYFYEDTGFDGPDFDFLGESIEVDNFRTQSNQLYLQGSYGITKAWEVYGRLGFADIKVKDGFEYDGGDVSFDDDAKLFGTLGVKGVFYSTKKFSLGFFGQGTMYSKYKDSFSTYDDVLDATLSGDIKIKDYYNVMAGLSGSLKFGECSIYGGPFFYYARAKVEVSGTAASIENNFVEARSEGPSIISLSASDKVDARSNIGGFFGINMAFTKQFKLNLEVQVRDYISGGALLTYAF